jgi:hypothetical protein
MLGCFAWLVLTFIQLITAAFCVMLWAGGVNVVPLLIAFLVFNIPLVLIKNAVVGD